MTLEWTPIFVLPNLPLDQAIDCEIAAIAPAHDTRVRALTRRHPALRQFLSRFSDNFGEKFEPAVLLLDAAAPPSFRDIAALGSLRDVIALSTITHGRALELRHPRGHRILFGEAFAIYPWMLDRHYEDLIGSTPAILGTHQVANFRGQSSPALFRTSLSTNDIDGPLLTALITRWRRRYEALEPSWADVALMRSINMAYHASLLPAGTETTFYDIGRIVSLWVSAFEILVHPGGSDQANREKVFGLIESTPWTIPASGQLIYDTGGKTKVKRTLASWLVQMLYDCRNNFLHGNPVERSMLVVPMSQRTIFEYAAPLYRIALTAFLPLEFEEPMPASTDSRGLGAYISGRMAFMDPQKNAEKALLTATRSPPN